MTELEAKRTLTVGVFSIASDDESDGVNPEDELRTVLSMLDDVLLPEFVFCKKEKVSGNLSTCSFDWNRSSSDGCVSKYTNKHLCHIFIKYR